MSARKLSRADYPLLAASITELVQELGKSPTKAMHKYLDAKVALDSLRQFEHAYIVGDCYLVVFDLGVPWYSRSLFLHELLVLRLMPGANFDLVTAFLEQSAKEAGAVLVAAGTALASSDAALASMYRRRGFTEQATTLTKEIEWAS